MTFKDLFRTCAYDIRYQQVGKDVNYAFREEGQTLYIFFEGSDGRMDWRRNLRFWKRPYKSMETKYWVHAGFLAAWKEVQDIVIQKIQEKTRDGGYRFQKIYSIGYSHGGALAAFAHECCWFHREDIRKKIYGIGFEAPRILGGFRVKRQIKERWNQFVVFRNRQDLVTHLPPAWMGFRHVGRVVRIGGDWQVSAALKGLFKKGQRWRSAAELGCVLPHYQNEVLRGLGEFDKSNEGIALRMAMELGRDSGS